MKLTTNFGLKKPEGSDVVNVDDFNYNADILDTKIKEIENQSSTNKTNITNNTNLANQALTKANEAFQRGDNVKTQLVDKLISIGLDVSTNNTFEELIRKIENIQVSKRVIASDNVLSGSVRTDSDVSSASREYVVASRFYIGLSGSIRVSADLMSATTSVTGYMIFNLIRDGSVKYSSSEFTSKGAVL